MPPCDPPSLTPVRRSHMQRTKSNRSQAKCLKKKRRFMSSIKRVSHLSRRAKRRLYCRLQLWMWRRWKVQWSFWIYRTRKQASVSSGSCRSVKTPSQKSKIKAPAFHTPHLRNPEVGTSSRVYGNGGSEKPLSGQNFLLSESESISQTDESPLPSSSQKMPMDINGALGNVGETVPPQKEDTLVQLIDMTEPLEELHAVKLLSTSDSDSCGSLTNVKDPKPEVSAQRSEINSPLRQFTPDTPCQDRVTNNKANKNITSRKRLSSQTDVSPKIMTKDIHGFLDDFYSTYGSFVPLQKRDILRHLKQRCNTDFTERKDFIFSEVAKYRSALLLKPAPSFRVVYKKHSLTLDDLSTLADQNWLNDQVMNMYGELIMESAHHKVHFLNSFFHRQLMTKGYDGVKRWTKQVDLFSKSLLLVPIHLEVHWCLVTADLVRKRICLYDSKGHPLQKIGRNIQKYLMTEAKERKRTAFETGWVVSTDEKVPLQSNENDCGVFVLEYSRCLALDKPVQFSQRDIPKIRKRIYKELCECKLHEQG